MQPPQARQIGAVRPFRGHRPARAGARRRTAVPAMAHAERLQEYNCANAIVRLGGRYAPPERVTVFHGTTDDNLRRSIDFARRPPEGLHADDIERALQSGNRYAARVLIWARSGDMRHLALMETCRRRLAANGPAGAPGNIAGRRADKGSAGDSANGTATNSANETATNSANGTAINSENSTARNSASETAHYRANGAAHRADKGKARAPANWTARASGRGTAEGSENSRPDATADNAPKGYLVCPTCGNIYPAECSRFLLPLLPDRRAEIRRVRRVTRRRSRIFTRLSRAARPNRPERIPSARRIRTARHGSGAWFCRGNRCRRSSRPHGAGPAARNRRSADHRGNY